MLEELKQQVLLQTSKMGQMVEVIAGLKVEVEEGNRTKAVLEKEIEDLKGTVVTLTQQQTALLKQSETTNAMLAQILPLLIGQGQASSSVDDISTPAPNLGDIQIAGPSNLSKWLLARHCSYFDLVIKLQYPVNAKLQPLASAKHLQR